MAIKCLGCQSCHSFFPCTSTIKHGDTHAYLRSEVFATAYDQATRFQHAEPNHIKDDSQPYDEIFPFNFWRFPQPVHCSEQISIALEIRATHSIWRLFEKAVVKQSMENIYCPVFFLECHFQQHLNKHRVRTQEILPGTNIVRMWAGPSPSYSHSYPSSSCFPRNGNDRCSQMWAILASNVTCPYQRITNLVSLWSPISTVAKLDFRW
jgi:hypothetical protein